MEKLPSDIMLDILSRLPYETIINCELVCKPWRDITNNIKIGFIFQQCKMHENYSYKMYTEINDDHPLSIELEPPLSDIVGSCNGLVCFTAKGKSCHAHDPVYICNPITEEYVYLPTFNYNKACNNGKTDGYYFDYGFGYHYSTDEYKVVRIYYDYDEEDNVFSKLFSPYDEKCGHVQVYTLGSGHGWRDIGRIDYCLHSYRGVCANGALLWIENRERKIVAFDLRNEEFRLIPFPPLSPNRHYNFVHLRLMLGGYLCVVHVDVGKEDRILHVWALEKKNKLNSSYDTGKHDFYDFWEWSKKYSIPCARDARYVPFAVTKSNQVLMTSHNTIFCYELRTNVLREICDDSLTWNNFAIPHVNSHVSLEALGEISKRRK